MRDIKIFEIAQSRQVSTYQGTSGKPLLSLKNVCITNGLQAKKSMKKLPDEMIVRVPVQRGLKKSNYVVGEYIGN